jgi:hypothetical protein
MGAGIFWYAASRQEAGAAPGAAIRRVVLRGLVLFLIAQIFEQPLISLANGLAPPEVSLNQITAPPPNDGSDLYWAFITLSGLGLTMIVCGFLLLLRPWAWLLTSALCLVATHALLPASGKPGPWWVTILLTPGLSEHILVVYPVVPWLAGAAAGMYFGWWWRRNPDWASRRVWILGAVLLLIGIAVRAEGGWGNIRPPRDTGWIEFLNNVKYPPSLVFWAISLGIAFLLLALLTRLPRAVTSARSPLIVFGQTPLFFYLAHFGLLILLAFLFFRRPASLEGAWLMWAVVLAALYPVCSWYRNFKMSRSAESLWRMF